MKKNYAKLIKLVDLTYADESAEERVRWLENVLSTGVEDGYTVQDLIDVEGEETTQVFDTGDMQRTDEAIYDFIGSEFGRERFYEREEKVYKHKDGTRWAIYKDELFEV